VERPLMRKDLVRIGGASGFWGDSATGAVQLVNSGQVDYLVFDYLSELTMSLLASARLKNPELGYATDFVAIAMRAVLKDALERGIRIIANAGGVNPRACAAALAGLAAELNIDASIAVVEGDDAMPQLAELRAEGIDLPEKILSANAYLGALPIKRALDAGAQVVITGRCVDSAVTLGALLHEFDWRTDDYDRLAAASLAGHLIECGCQGVGGLHTDWEAVPDWAHSGYPIVACRPDGGFSITKPAGSGGLVTPATVAEQLLYEIGDPARYILPDVVCDFTAVTLEQAGRDVVEVRGAKGYPPTSTYKVTATCFDGYRCNAQLTVVGFDAERKARRTAEAILERTRELFSREGLGDYSGTHVEVLGSAFSFGPHVANPPLFEAVMWLAVTHPDKRALQLFAREIAPAGTSWAPGTTGAAGRPGVSPAIKQASFLIGKQRLVPSYAMLAGGGVAMPVAVPPGADGDSPVAARFDPLAPAPHDGEMVTVPLIWLAYARSGDKGDTSNIGVIARRPDYVPLLRAQLTGSRVAAHLAHLVAGKVTRFELPGIHALNFVCEQALGGGGLASLRNDALGKGMAQVLLAMPVRVPSRFVVH
jgi:hypothetical protein